MTQSFKDDSIPIAELKRKYLQGLITLADFEHRVGKSREEGLITLSDWMDARSWVEGNPQESASSIALISTQSTRTFEGPPNHKKIIINNQLKPQINRLLIFAVIILGTLVAMLSATLFYLTSMQKAWSAIPASDRYERPANANSPDDQPTPNY